MLILSVESSCDETAVAITENGRTVLSNAVVSQIDLHKLYGGVVPEIASRRHIEIIYSLADKAMAKAEIAKSDISAVAATFAPGLIGALLVGMNFGKALAFSLGVPFVPVHHIRGHVAANYIAFPALEPPFCALVASGGHTLILGVDSYTNYRVLGSTRDDAAGEVFDKIARVLGIGYPGGVEIDSRAALGDDSKYTLPRAKLSAPYDMSFSGLKTATINLIHNAEQKGDSLDIPSLCASFQRAVSDEIIPRTISAAQENGYKIICAAGGVAANSRLRADLEALAKTHRLETLLPPLSLCGDNGAMIGCQGYYEYLENNTGGMDTNAYATLSSDYDFATLE